MATRDGCLQALEIAGFMTWMATWTATRPRLAARVATDVLVEQEAPGVSRADRVEDTCVWTCWVGRSAGHLGFLGRARSFRLPRASAVSSRTTRRATNCKCGCCKMCGFTSSAGARTQLSRLGRVSGRFACDSGCRSARSRSEERAPGLAPLPRPAPIPASSAHFHLHLVLVKVLVKVKRSNHVSE